LPGSGRTYMFTAVTLPANDASITALYTLGKLPIDVSPGHAVTAVVKNAGSSTLSNVTVTLNITGANTFTNNQNILSLAAGASTTVTFSTFMPTALGSNTVTVSVPSDGNNTNNSQTQSLTTTFGTIGYATSALSTSAIGYNTGAGLILNKYAMQGSGYVRTVNVFLPSNSAGNTVTGQTVYAVVLNNAGAIVGQSANYVVQAADQNNWKSFVITTPPSFTSTDFYVGLAQTANATTGYYPVATQDETPTRSGAYYTAALAGGATTQQTTFGRFMIEAGLNTTLPVTLINFAGQRDGKSNILTWATATEINNKGFELERSADGTKFSSIGFIATKAEGGNSTSSIDYSFTDNKTLAGTNYYRLRQVDKDGRSSYSSVVKLKGEKIDMAISALYPNPAKDEMRLAIVSSTNEKVTISITDLSGKEVKRINTAVTPGDNNIDLNVSALSTGTYYLRLISATETKTTKFIKN
jgi:hypothetical protein